MLDMLACRTHDTLQRLAHLRQIYRRARAEEPCPHVGYAAALQRHTRTASGLRLAAQLRRAARHIAQHSRILTEKGYKRPIIDVRYLVERNAYLGDIPVEYTVDGALPLLESLGLGAQKRKKGECNDDAVTLRPDSCRGDECRHTQ